MFKAIKLMGSCVKSCLMKYVFTISFYKLISIGKQYYLRKKTTICIEVEHTVSFSTHSLLHRQICQHRKFSWNISISFRVNYRGSFLKLYQTTKLRFSRTFLLQWLSGKYRYSNQAVFETQRSKRFRHFSFKFTQPRISFLPLLKKANDFLKFNLPLFKRLLLYFRNDFREKKNDWYIYFTTHMSLIYQKNILSRVKQFLSSVKMPTNHQEIDKNKR